MALLPIPEGLTALEYSRHILEFELCWPAKSNIELIADCITSLSKGKKLTLDKAYRYLARAIDLHRKQGGVVDRMFFLNGDYANVRPEKERADRYALEAERAKNYAAHGCNSGWVYVTGGVKRCEKCVGK